MFLYTKTYDLKESVLDSKIDVLFHIIIDSIVDRSSYQLIKKDLKSIVEVEELSVQYQVDRGVGYSLNNIDIIMNDILHSFSKLKNYKDKKIGVTFGKVDWFLALYVLDNSFNDYDIVILPKIG